MKKGLISLLLITTLQSTHASHELPKKKVFDIDKHDKSIVSCFIGKINGKCAIVWERTYKDGSSHKKILQEGCVGSKRFESLFYHKSDPSSQYQSIERLDESLFLDKTDRRTSEV